MNSQRLNADVRIEVEYEDESLFGGPLSAKLQHNLKTLYAPIYRALEEHGPEYVIEHAQQLLGNVRGEPLFETIRDPADRLRFAPDVLYPDSSKIRPLAVHLKREDGSSMRLVTGDDFLPAVHDAISQLAGDPAAPEDTDAYEAIVEAAGKRGFLNAPSGRDIASVPDSDATFVGHNAVIVRSRKAAVLVDPWLLPQSGKFAPDYQPLSRSQLGLIDAILITHSHPDHFDPGTLLQFQRNTKVIVPRVERESLLSADLELRLRQLGFEHVHVLDWWQQTTVGDIEITALPFYGEQPTTDGQICPEVRNFGNTYVVRTPTFSCALVADSGRDREGDVRSVALESMRRWGGIDVLFTGYRGWSLYPIQYFESSVRQYLLFVPQYLYTVRQSIMNGVAEAVDTAEAWHANYLVPYGDGGAPWYAELGLGPDPRTCYGENHREWLHFDPLPERCLDELRARSSPIPGVVVGSPVRPLLLRPGQSVHLSGDGPVIEEIPGHRWPKTMGATA